MRINEKNYVDKAEKSNFGSGRRIKGEEQRGV